MCFSSFVIKFLDIHLSGNLEIGGVRDLILGEVVCRDSKLGKVELVTRESIQYQLLTQELFVSNYMNCYLFL